MLLKKFLCNSKNKKIFDEFKLLENKIITLTNDSRDLLCLPKHTGQF